MNDSIMNEQWLPDRDLLAESSAWVVGKEPLLVRVSPLVSVLLICGLAFWVWSIQVATPELIPVSIADLETIAGGQIITAVAPSEGPQEVVRGDEVVLKMPSASGDRMYRVKCVVTLVTQFGNSHYFTLESEKALPEAGSGLLVLEGEHMRLSEIMIKKFKSKVGLI